MTLEPAKHPASQPQQGAQRVVDGDPSSTSTTATSGPTLVKTRWFVDYNTIAGETTKIPARQSDDQLVVDELKIWPNKADAPEVLEGGNMARSGAVDLGTAMVPKGSGNVSAAVRYAKKKAFDIKIDLAPAPSRAEAKAVKELNSQIHDAVFKELEHRGDYEAIAALVQERFKDAIAGKTLSIAIRPISAAKPGTSYVTPGKGYSAKGDARFKVTVAPSKTQDRSVTWTNSKSGEVNKTHSETSGVSSSTETVVERNKKLVVSAVNSFANGASSAIQTIFKDIEGQMLSERSPDLKEWSKTTTWKAEIGQSKDERKGEDDKKEEESKPSLTDRIVEKVKSVGGWLVSKATGVAKKIPFVGSAVSFLGDLWGTISGRGSISRETAETDKTTKGTERTTTSNVGHEYTSLNTLTEEWKQTITTEMRSEVANVASAHLGTKVSNEHNDGAGNKDTVGSSVSGTTVTHELGAPILEVEEMT